MEEERETLLERRKNKKSSPLKGYSIVEDGVESNNFLMWVFLDQSSLWRAGLSWSIFFLLAVGVPLLSHFVFKCSNCEETHRRPYDDIVQLSLSIFSTLSFISLSSFTRKYGLRKFLFLDKLFDVSQKVRQGYTLQLHKSMKLLCAFVLPIFAADSIYKIWWFISGGNEIPYFYNMYLSHTLACLLQMCSWLYRTSIFFFVCVLFRLICYLQILRLEDFAQVFEKESDVGLILIEHLTIRRNLRIISHRFRGFILSTLILVTASQFVSLLVTTKSGSDINIFTGGVLAGFYILWGLHVCVWVPHAHTTMPKLFHLLCSITLVTGLFICLRSAAKITHRAHAVTSLAAKWHICATINSFDDLEEENPTTQITSTEVYPISASSESEEGDGDDELDNTNMVPIHVHTISYQKRQALVTYFENNRAGITVFGFMLDRTSLHTIFAIQLSLTLWLLNKTIGIS